MIEKLIHGKIPNVQDFHYVTLRSLPSDVSLQFFGMKLVEYFSTFCNI